MGAECGGNGTFEIGNLKLEIGNWKLETGNWKLEIGNWKLEKPLARFFCLSFDLGVAPHRGASIVHCTDAMRLNVLFQDISNRPFHLLRKSTIQNPFQISRIVLSEILQ